MDVNSFFQHFRGNFKGKRYNSSTPASRVFKNANSCKGFSGFISKETDERIRNGSLRVWGKVGECEPPLIIMPLTVEPSKRRLCYNARYLNLWIKECPF